MVYEYDEISDIKEVLVNPKIIALKNRGKRQKRYYDLCCGFDIETTTLKNKKAYMYIWQMSINDNVIIGRYWHQFTDLINRLRNALTLRKSTRVIIWVANLGYEFQFIRKLVNVTDLFAKEIRQPIYFVVDDSIEFRDALTVSGGSLASLARRYTKTQKLVGDLDYSILRNNETILSAEELQYCINDVVILSEFARYIFDVYAIKQKYIPLTKTGILRHEVKKLMPFFARAAIQKCFPCYDLYKKMMTYAFMGGVTHANRKFAGRVILGSASVDITSSYPAAMLTGYYPMSPFKNSDFKEEYLEKYCCLLHIEFYNISASTTHSIISKSKCISVGAFAIWDNGRLIRCDFVEVFITEIDFKIFKMFYRWEKMKIKSCQISRRGKLPEYLLKPIFDAYKIKQKLKKEGKSGTIEYQESKAKVNSGYGMTVTRMVEHEIIYNDDWIVLNDFDYEEEIKKQFLLPQWGVWVTAHARYALLSIINKFPDDVMYYDTDSIKFINFDKNILYINDYNTIKQNQISEICKEKNWDIDIFWDLGSYETEYSNCQKFKTLGAKRYIYTDSDGVNHVTIAGLPKNTLTNHASKTGKDIYDIFNDGMYLDVTISDKKTTCYNDEPHEDLIDGVLMRERSSVGIYDIPFKMNLETFYLSMIKSQIEEGAKYEKRNID